MSIESITQLKPASPEPVTVDDVQGRADSRNIPIDRVGIKSLRHPMAFEDRSGVQNTVGEFDMSILLSAEHKGTHMSRFVDILNNQSVPLSVANFQTLLVTMQQRLEASRGIVEISFPWFVTKSAPVSGVRSMVDYQVLLSGDIEDGDVTVTTSVTIPVTSLCPCSKQISDYGAHNQRSHVTIEVETSSPIFLEELIAMVEAQASAELYGTLKRVDEKYVTEKAYDNPKFVEDMVRDVATVFDQDTRIDAYCVEVENFESIHNHSAYAEISRVKS